MTRSPDERRRDKISPDADIKSELEGTIRSDRRADIMDLAGFAAFVSVAVLVLLRLDDVIDLSDEGYYALFIDDWLKGGVRTSTYLVLHQTAALLVYPFARLYVYVTGSSDGLMLFLREIYWICSIASSGLLVYALRRLGLGVGAWTGGLLLLAFIPFGLPAPSYNTIGSQALCLALAGYACGTRAAGAASSQAWFGLSAIAWAVATIAYPSLVLAAGVMALLLVRVSGVASSWRYLAMVAGAQVAGWLVVIIALSPPHLWRSLKYHAAITEEGGLPGKLGRGVDLLQGEPVFVALCIAALLIGLARRCLPGSVSATLVMILLGVSLLQPPALFLHSHDVVTLLAITGIGNLWDLRRGADDPARILSVLFAVSLTAGAATMLSATNLLYNFCVGAAVAAALAVVTLTPLGQAKRQTLPVPAAAVAVGTILSASLTFHYGGLPAPEYPRQRISSGFYEGIKTDPRDVRLLQIVQTQIVPMLRDDHRTVFIGRVPGVMLHTHARLLMPWSFPLSPKTSARGLATTADFYRSPERRPATVIIYRDPYFEPLNPMGAAFANWYSLTTTVSTPLGTMSVYGRR